MTIKSFVSAAIALVITILLAVLIYGIRVDLRNNCVRTPTIGSKMKLGTVTLCDK